jgi:hypothetical protein
VSLSIWIKPGLSTQSRLVSQGDKTAGTGLLAQKEMSSPRQEGSF